MEVHIDTAREAAADEEASDFGAEKLVLRIWLRVLLVLGDTLVPGGTTFYDMYCLAW